VGLLFLACLHNVPDSDDSDDPAGLVARYLTALAPGSYLVISHVTDEFAPEQMHAVTAESARRGTTFNRAWQGCHRAHVQRQGAGRSRARAHLLPAARI
jgi:hypothetical protein